MLSRIPIDLAKVEKSQLDREMVSLYEQLAAMTEDQNIKKVLLDVAREEKTHAGEFQALLLRIDQEQEEELAHGREEVEELTGKK
ncbi:MAG: rubrerythrin [Deltaproteobacteria bacterium]|nr:rubrerythrin [Deltaproteobacteria bacterium]